ncbi:MAG: DUF2284 domain-containing protein [Deltaproteobacteria bacterium]|nr:DUF2284 domain-containing protein [Deltaproteobacteria bacterium]
MNDPSIERYCARAVDEGGATQARVISLSTVVTAPWVRLKCQFGCPGYGRSYGCPPDSPTPRQTQEIIDSYHRAILFHLEAARAPDGSRRKQRHRLYDALVTLEGEFFKDGCYKAFVFLSGPCHLCRECGKLKGEACRYGDRARPSMEACGIDVYQTARNNGFFIEPLREKSETQNIYCLMLVD